MKNLMSDFLMEFTLNPFRIIIGLIVFSLSISLLTYSIKEYKKISNKALKNRKIEENIHFAKIDNKNRNYFQSYFILKYKSGNDSVNQKLIVPESIYLAYNIGQIINVDSILIQRAKINESESIPFIFTTFIYRR